MSLLDPKELCPHCGKRHVRLRKLDMFARDYLSRELDIPDDVLDQWDADLRREAATQAPTGKPGRPAKYLTPDEKREANAQYQREYRRRRKAAEQQDEE